MPRTCLSQLSQLIDNALALTTPSRTSPMPKHTGLVFQAPRRTRPSSNAFPAAPDCATSAFDRSQVDGAAHRAHRRQLIAALWQPVKVEREGGGTSWEVGGEDVDGWRVGWEKATQMFVKRKGRGKFGFVAAVMEGYGGGCGDEEGACGGRLKDGFAYRAWVGEEEVDTEFGYFIGAAEGAVGGMPTVLKKDQEREHGYSRRTKW